MSQQIIWKYETPLQGKYLAAGFYGGITAGLVEPVTVAWNGSKSVVISPYQVYVGCQEESASGAYVEADLLVKIQETEEVTVALTDDTAAVGISYIWMSDSAREAEYETLTLSQVEGYAGVILFMVDVANRRAYTQAADFCNAYLASISSGGYFLRHFYPRDEGGFSATKFKYDLLQGDMDSYRLTLQYTNTDTANVSVYVVNPDRVIDLDGYGEDTYYLLGFRTLQFGTDVNPTLPDISLEVLDSADTMSALSCGLSYQPVAVVYWMGNAFDSNVYPVEMGTSAQTYDEQSEFGVDASAMLIREQSQGNLERIQAYPEYLAQESRETIESNWVTNTKINKRQVQSWFFTETDSFMWVGQGTRHKADLVRGSVGHCFFDPSKTPSVVLFMHCGEQDDESKGLMGSDGDYTSLYSGETAKTFLEVGSEINGIEVTYPVDEYYPKWEDARRVIYTAQSCTIAPYLPDEADSRIFGFFACPLGFSEEAGLFDEQFLRVIFEDGYYFTIGAAGNPYPYWDAELPSDRIAIADNDIHYVDQVSPYLFYEVTDDSVYSVKLFDSGDFKYPVRFYFYNGTSHYVHLEYGAPSHQGADIPSDTTVGVEFLSEDSYGLFDPFVGYSEATAEYPLPYTAVETIVFGGVLYDEDGVEQGRESCNIAVSNGSWLSIVFGVDYSSGTGKIFSRCGDHVFGLSSSDLTVDSKIASYVVNRSKDEVLLAEFFEVGLYDSDNNIIDWSSDIEYPPSFIGASDRYLSLCYDEGFRTNIFESDVFKEAFDERFTEDLEAALETDIAVGGNLSASGTLTVTGAATLKSSLSVAGKTTLTGDAAAKGNLSASGTLSVTGAATLKSSLSVAGESTLTGDVAAKGNLSVAGNITAAGTVSAGQIVVPLAQPESLENGSIWLSD